MRKYSVFIREELVREVIVEAESKEAAIEKVEDQYEAGEHILDADDFIGVEFEAMEH